MVSNYEPLVISKPCMACGAKALGHKAWFWDYLGLTFWTMPQKAVNISILWVWQSDGHECKIQLSLLNKDVTSRSHLTFLFRGKVITVPFYTVYIYLDCMHRLHRIRMHVSVTLKPEPGPAKYVNLHSPWLSKEPRAMHAFKGYIFLFHASSIETSRSYMAFSLTKSSK